MLEELVVLAHSDGRIGRISPFSQNPLSSCCCQRLSARDNSIGTVNNAPPAGKGDEIRVNLGEDRLGVESHLDCGKVSRREK